MRACAGGGGAHAPGARAGAAAARAFAWAIAAGGDAGCGARRGGGLILSLTLALALTLSLALSPTLTLTLVKAGEEACQRVDEARLLAWLLPLRPRLVTIARSVDGFLPFHCTARIEAAVLRVLAAAAASFNASLRVEHLPGTATGAALQAMTDGLGARARAGGVR